MAVAVDIGTVNAPFRVAEVRSVGESDGWGDDMANGADGTLGEVHHAVDLRGEVAAHAEVHQIAESVDGIGLQMSCRVRVVNPVLLDTLEIHVVVK